MNWATGFTLGISTGLCLQAAGILAERRRTRQKVAGLVQDGTLRITDRSGQPLSGEQVVAALDRALAPDPATAKQKRTLVIVAVIVCVLVAVAVVLVARRP